MIGNKKGLSTIIATLLIVLLTLFLAGIVWGVVTKMTKDSLAKSQSCFEIFNKVILDESYTCFNVTAKELVISLSVKDIDVDEVTVGISADGETDSFKIPKEGAFIQHVGYYNNTTLNLIPPSKNSGLAYVYNFTAVFGGVSFPDSIEVAPKVNGNQCETSSSIQEIASC